MTLLDKIIFSGITIALSVLLSWILRRHVHSGLKRWGLKETQEKLLGKMYALLVLFILVVALVSIWGIEIQDLWLFLTSVVGLVAIGFVAVWSLLGNVLAGWLLLTSGSIKINDSVEIVGDKVKGKVKDITLIFTVLQDTKGNRINIPNNLMLQKVVKVMKR